MIQRVQQELQELNDEKMELHKQKIELSQRQEVLKEEYQRFPAHTGVNDAFQLLEETRRDVHSLAKDIQSINERFKKHAEELQRIKNQLVELAGEFSLSIEEKGFEQAQRSMREYQNHLQKLQLRYKDYVKYRDELKQLHIRLEEMIEDVDALQGEVNGLKDDRDTFILQLEQIQKRLQELGAEEIQAKISQIEQRIQQIPTELEALIHKRADAENRIGQLNEQMEKLGDELTFINEMVRHWKNVFLKDYSLQLVKQNSNDPEMEVTNKGEQTLQLAKQVKQELAALFSQVNTDRESVTNKLIEVYYKEQGLLVEYRLTQQDVMEIEETPESGDDELFQAQVEQLKIASKRIQLYMDYNGSRVTPYYVMEHIEKDIALQQSILTQKDRELFEEIIMNNIGRIIRTRINRAEHWVKKMNRLMEERDTSSGLTFSVRWKPKTADVEEEMDTYDLVELLRSDARLLKEADIDRVTRHFRSKIERAKELMEEKGYGETLHQAIKEILDYRKWFAFTLYYKREGEQRKELTNNVFYTYSGGEKAMAMYIPLFSAAYSRYAEARDDAPYIISLDEAFAGVDENNIRDMFDLVEKLGFDYIINSQALWGDYDTVSSLSICELVRPKNAPFVTVVRYLWDGNVRKLLHDTEVLDEELEFVNQE